MSITATRPETPAPGLGRRGFLRAAGIGALALGTPLAFTTPAMAAGKKELKTTWQQQSTGYYCGPTAAAIAISAKATPPSQDALAKEIGTSSQVGSGRLEVAAAMTRHTPGATYRDHDMTGSQTATKADADLLWKRATKNVDDGYATLCNWLILPGQYPDWGGNKGEIGHFVVIDGYDSAAHKLRIADPAGVVLSQSLPHYHWLSAQQVANFCAARGYAW